MIAMQGIGFRDGNIKGKRWGKKAAATHYGGVCRDQLGWDARAWSEGL